MSKQRKMISVYKWDYIKKVSRQKTEKTKGGMDQGLCRGGGGRGCLF